MVFPKLELIYKSKTVAGVELIFQPEGGYLIHLVAIRKNKNELQFIKKNNNIKSIEALAKELLPQTPFVLVLNGKGIVHKKLNYSPSDTDATLLQKVLPNASPTEFCIQKTIIDQEHLFVSVIRNSVLNEFINALKKHNLMFIHSCLLGPFCINLALPLIDQKIIDKELLRLNSFALQIRENRITDIFSNDQEETNKIPVGDEKLEASLLIAFCAAFSYFTPQHSGIENDALLNEFRTEALQKRKFQTASWAVAIGALLLLVCNYLVFDHYWKKSNEMNTQLVLSQSALNQLDTLKKEYAQKEDFFQRNGLLESARTSFYADRLAGSLPSTIQWTDVIIHPQKRVESNEVTTSFLFENKRIQINGVCTRSTELNDWMKELKKKTWIEDVSLVDYKQDQQEDNGVFSIEIKIN